jgi:LuxR family maltose regulon positive regulatory protein
LLATVYHEQGRLRLAEACYQRVAQEAREIGDREDLVPALLGLAHLAYEWNDLEAAERSAQEARDLSEQAGYHPLLVRATLLLLRIWSLQGQKLLVEHHLSVLLARFHAHQSLYAGVYLYQLHGWLQEGDLTTVRHALETWKLPAGDEAGVRTAHQLLQWRVALASKEYSRAGGELESWQRTAQAQGQGRLLLQYQLLQARLLLAQGQTPRACQTLEAALVKAHPQGYLRVFLDEGQDIAALLQLMQTRQKDQSLHAYVRTLLRASEIAQVSLPRTYGLPALSRQEQRVLRLILAERSYPEIARELVVSLNTIKTQVTSIYRKLNVHSRREARAIARDLRLLSPDG